MIRRKNCFTLCVPRGFSETFKLDFFFHFCGQSGFDWIPQGVLTGVKILLVSNKYKYNQ